MTVKVDAVVEEIVKDTTKDILITTTAEAPKMEVVKAPNEPKTTETTPVTESQQEPAQNTDIEKGQTQQDEEDDEEDDEDSEQGGGGGKLLLFGAVCAAAYAGTYFYAKKHNIEVKQAAIQLSEQVRDTLKDKFAQFKEAAKQRM